MSNETNASAAAELVVLESTGSTNDDVRERALTGAVAGTAVAARVQTAGRGRRGHTWTSPKGCLALSVLLRPSVPMQHFMGLSAVCSLGVLTALREDLGVTQAALKWPNDVVLDGKKLAGILVEAGSSAQGPYAVCGIGLNVAHAPAAADDACGLPHPALAAACLADVAPEAAVRPFEELARAVRDRVVAAVDAWVAQVAAGRAQAGPLAPILNEYFDAIPLLGRPVAVYGSAGDRLCEGVFAGIDAWGRATVHLADGRDVEYAAEQASLRSLI